MTDLLRRPTRAAGELTTPFTEAGPAVAEHVARYGFAIIDAALSPDEVDAINAEAVRLCKGELGDIAAAPDIAGIETEADLLRRFLCIHHPHKISQVLADALAAPRIVPFLTSVIGPDVKSMQSMLFIKSEGKPGQAWHQDEFFIPTRDRSLTAVWIALDDATVENGCLWVLPGSHRPGVIYPDREHDDPEFDCSVELYDFPYSDEDAVPVELKAGQAVIFNGYLLHRSLRNSGKHGFRRALANHYMNAHSLLPWGHMPSDTHIAKWDHRDIVMIAGEDPYAWKGTTDVHRPHVRADRDGGCGR